MRRLAHGVRKVSNGLDGSRMAKGLDGSRMACGRFPKAWTARAWRAEGFQRLGRPAHGVRKVSRGLDGPRVGRVGF